MEINYIDPHGMFLIYNLCILFGSLPYSKSAVYKYLSYIANNNIQLY
jgi:hypothetical protein